MEVHHHPQPGKKNFKEYFLEGLMIFLAVMLGFIAENVREGISDNAKAKEYINSFIQNLKDDTTGISNTIIENTRKLENLQRLMSLSRQDLSSTETRKDLYNYCGSSVGFYSIFKSNDATMQQLKNSGAMRFIKKGHVADSIAKYDIEMYGVYSAGTIYTNANDIGILASHELLDYSVYYDSSYMSNKKFTAKILPLLTNDPAKQKLFFNKVDFEIGATKNYLNNLRERRPFAIRLLDFLKKEYHLEKE